MDVAVEDDGQSREDLVALLPVDEYERRVAEGLDGPRGGVVAQGVEEHVVAKRDEAQLLAPGAVKLHEDRVECRSPVLLLRRAVDCDRVRDGLLLLPYAAVRGGPEDEVVLVHVDAAWRVEREQQHVKGRLAAAIHWQAHVAEEAPPTLLRRLPSELR